MIEIICFAAGFISATVVAILFEVSRKPQVVGVPPVPKKTAPVDNHKAAAARSPEHLREIYDKIYKGEAPYE